MSSGVISLNLVFRVALTHGFRDARGVISMNFEV